MPAPIVWAADRNILADSSSETRSQLAASPDGRLSVFWNSNQANGNIFNYIYGADPATSIAGVGIDSPGFEASPGSAFLTDGRLVLAYAYSPTVGGDIDIRFRVMNGADQNFSTLVANVVANAGATTGNQVSPVVLALANGNFAISWADLSDNKQKVRVFDVAGNPVSGVTAVSPTAVLSLESPNPSNQPTNMTALSNGGFAVIYNTIGSDRMSIFSAAGALLTADIVLPIGADSNSAVVETADGRIAVIGADLNVDLGYLIQFFSLAGLPLGAATALTPPEAAFGNDIHVRAVALPDGRIMVVSSRSIEAAANADVWAAMIKPDGTFDGTPFRVNDTQAGSQSAPSIALMADGRVAISWTDTTANNGDIFLKIYDPRETGVELVGTAGTDDYVGSRFNDTISGGLGNDTVKAGTGNDSVSGGRGGDSLRGEGGNDTLDGGIGADVLFGGDGDDSLVGGDNSDTMYGEAGNDVFRDDYGQNTMEGGQGDDYFIVGGTTSGSVNRIVGQEGFDSVQFGEAIFLDMTTNAQGGNALNVGLASGDVEGWVLSNGADRLHLGATFAASLIYGNGGADTLDGGSGNDTIYGGGDNDTLNGQIGNDTLYGDAGNDTFFDAFGANRMEGGAGGDYFIAANTLSGSVSQIIGGADFDSVQFNEAIVFDFATFTFTGNAAQVAIAQNDVEGWVLSNSADRLNLHNTLANSRVFGNGGADTLSGGLGQDTLNGGAGADTFLFQLLPGTTDTIEDFTTGQDRITVLRAWLGQPAGAEANIPVVNFVSGASPAPTFATPQLLYNTATGLLSFDPDGTGGAAAIPLASLGAGTALAASDVFMV
jgi:Ca2+-binding RTX toxin-like protein